MLSCHSHVRLFATQWTIALQAPLFMGFSRNKRRCLKIFTSLDIYSFFRWFKGPLSGPDLSQSLQSDRQSSGRGPTITPTSEVLVSWLSETLFMDLSGGPVVKTPPDNAGDTCLIPGLWKSHMPQGNEACVPQPLSMCSRVRALQQEKTLQWEAHTTATRE